MRLLTLLVLVACLVATLPGLEKVESDSLPDAQAREMLVTLSENSNLMINVNRLDQSYKDQRESLVAALQTAVAKYNARLAELQKEHGKEGCNLDGKMDWVCPEEEAPKDAEEGK